MILKLDEPISLEKARELYNDKNVIFITTTESYPNIGAIEFDDITRIEKRKIIAPRVAQKREKIVDKYKKAINKIWDHVFAKLKKDLKEEFNRTEKVVLPSERRKLIAQGRISELKRLLAEESRRQFTEAFKLGKIRGQVITSQEIDDDLTTQDEKEVDKRVEGNIEYLAEFSNNLQRDIDTILLGSFETYDEIDDAITEQVQEAKRSRANLYALAALGLVVAGTVLAIKEAPPDFRPAGGYWTLHPHGGKGGPVCDGCEENSGKWMTFDEFDEEYQTNECITNCRCDLDTRRII